jgi:hypothetical protein
MIVTFTNKIIVEPNFQPEFFFNRIYTASGIRIHVSVEDGGGQFCHFDMAESSGKWRIVNGPQPPDWIMKLEARLNDVICRGMLS